MIFLYVANTLLAVARKQVARLLLTTDNRQLTTGN
jgi:hypothetical protein